MRKVVVITGQDGAYLAELALEKGYEVRRDINHRASLLNTDRIDQFYQDPRFHNRHFMLHYGNLTDSTNLIRIVQQTRSDESYRRGALGTAGIALR